MKRNLLTLVLALFVSEMASGQDFSIDAYVVAGGGGTSSGGNYTLSGTVGEPSAGSALSGGGYILQGGFWPGLVVTTSGEVPQLFIQVSGQEVVISWAPAGSGYVLETSGTLEASTWLPAPEGNPVMVPATDAAAFYRLRKD